MSEEEEIESQWARANEGLRFAANQLADAHEAMERAKDYFSIVAAKRKIFLEGRLTTQSFMDRVRTK